MALWEQLSQLKANQNFTISQNSWVSWFSQDPYFWLENSFQYAENLNCDDEMHWVKLAQKYEQVTKWYKYNEGTWEWDIQVNIDLTRCQMCSAWDKMVALPLVSWISEHRKAMVIQWDWTDKKMRVYSDDAWPTPAPGWEFVFNISNTRTAPWVMFQDYFRYWVEVEVEEIDPETHEPYTRLQVALCRFNPNDLSAWYQIITPYDHNDITDDAIKNPSTTNWEMRHSIWAILNYNNTRLVVGSWQDVWVYYPELDRADYTWWWTQDESWWKTWWLKTLPFENWSIIIWLSCDFQFLKVWVIDEWWNTKIYFYQGNNNLRSTYVYNLIDLTWQKVLRVYSVNWTDYYTASMDWSAWYITFNKLIGKIPVQLFKQKKWLTKFDVNYKAQYLVGPTWVWAPFNSWAFYLADAYWIFKFTQNQDSYDTWYMKWRINNQITASNQAYWIDICKNFLYISYENKFYIVRLYDTWIDWYMNQGILISREYEWNYGWTFTKMLKEVRLHYELIPDWIFWNSWNWNGKIEIFVSPNNTWHTTSFNDEGWIKVMEIDKTWNKTRTEKSNRLNNLWDSDTPAFWFDWQTITYWIRITLGTEEKCTPVVREVKMIYSLKGKTNFNYDIWQE